MNIPDNLWNHCLVLKSKIDAISVLDDIGYTVNEGFVFLGAQDSDIDLNVRITKGEHNQEEWKTEKLIGHLNISYRKNEDPNLIGNFKLFLPLILAKFLKNNTPFIIAHMAQTLDGKICTNSGQSKWIGNDENLKHAHCLRAMVDGVLVGGNTIANDLPRLNVRHVKGANPVRLLLSNTFSDFQNLPKVPDMDTFVLRREGNIVEEDYDVITKVIYYEGNDDQERVDNLLSRLRQNGINSILLEGGAGTVSSFFLHNQIDWLQLHIAPIIFGSGKPFIQLSEINNVSEGKKLKNVFYNEMGDGIMMTGELN